MILIEILMYGNEMKKNNHNTHAKNNRSVFSPIISSIINILNMKINIITIIFLIE